MERRWLVLAGVSSAVAAVGGLAMFATDPSGTVPDAAETVVLGSLFVLVVLGIVGVAMLAARSRSSSLLGAWRASAPVALAVGGPTAVIFPAAIGVFNLADGWLPVGEVVTWVGMLFLAFSGAAVGIWLGIGLVAWGLARMLPSRWAATAQS